MVIRSTWAGVLLPLCFFSALVLGQSGIDGQPRYRETAQIELPRTEQASLGSESDSLIARIGISGVWKLGHPCTVAVRIPDYSKVDSNSQSSGWIPEVVEITTVDGDSVEVAYRRRIESTDHDRIKSGQSLELTVPIRIGRVQSVISASLLDSRGNVTDRQDYTLPADSGLSPTQPLIVTIGGTAGVEDLVRTSADGQQRSISVVNIDEARQLPVSALEYAPVDLLVLATASKDLLNQMEVRHWAAIDEFIKNGGACVISLGDTGDELRRFPHLINWLPGELLGQGIIRSPAALESLVNTDQAIQPFPATIWQSTRGQTRLTLSDSLGKQTAWWVAVPHGFGTIQVIASDLGHTSFAQWKHRRLLWERLVAAYLDKTDLESVKSGGGSNTDSYLGYNDLTGQLRATLEQFAGVQVVSFSQIAAILIGLVILIGPVDYFISVKWLKRPHLSWPLAGGILLVCSLALVWGYRQLRPDQIMTNTAGILDVDSQTGRAVGHQWSHIYSAEARLISVESKSRFTGTPIRLDWQGLPGAGLGGLQSSMLIERGMPAYQINLSSGSGTRIEEMGIPAAGSKSLYATWVEQLPLITIENASVSQPSQRVTGSAMVATLREMSTVDQLEGAIINPLHVDLRDAALFYHRWYYALKSRMPSGDRIMLSSQIIPRDISRRLNKQQEMDGKLTSSRWDPSDRGQLDRLLELMMFHKAATGKNYTSLTHRYQPILDHSNLLETSYAILVGRLDASPAELQIEESNDKSTFTGNREVPQTESNRTWVRILLPVITGK